MAFGAAAFEAKPRENRNILEPRDRGFTGWAEGAAGLIDRKAEWKPVDANVQEGADHCAETENESVEQGGFESWVHG
jgi:hypothetical protein